MKTINLLLLPLFFLTLITISCNKAAEFNPEATLSQNTWKLKSTSTNGEIQEIGNWRDDSYAFESDHTFSFVSNGAYPYQYRGVWEIEQDRLLLRTYYNENDLSEYSDSELIIYELSNSTLILGYRFEQNGQMNSFKSIYKFN